MTLFSFRLLPDFIDTYRKVTPPFGYRDAGGNSLGEITFLRTYSRLKEDGSKETWVDVCERVINGMFSIQKDHCKTNRLPWNDNKAQHSAQDAFDRLFNLKWSPPGRGLWMMGTPLVMQERNSAALQNCSFISTNEMTKNDPSKPFAFLMEASMLGIGVGFDDKGADKGFTIYSPSKQPPTTYVIPDTREGWVESTCALINSYLKPDQHPLDFDYSQIRPAGTPIKTFGGTAAGPEPLMKLHGAIDDLFKNRAGSELTRTDIADLGNLIGVCVVSGNVRRSAELLMGRLDDDDFINLKNYEANPHRMEWGWMSNNSVEVSVGDDLSKIIDGIALNGEPGVIWMDVTREYGRLIDPPTGADWRAAGYNPCVTSDTWVMTDEGPRQVRDLISRKFTAVVDGKPYAVLSNGFWLTGVDREVFDLVTDSGWTVRVTDNHQILTQRGWVEASALRNGDEIVLNDHSDGTYWSGRGSSNEGYLLGHLWGDGTLKEASAILRIWGDGHHGLRTDVEKMARAILTVRSDWSGFTSVGRNQEWRLRSAHLAAIARSWGMGKGNKRITDQIEQGSWEFYQGFLQAAFDTDGHVEGNQEKGVSIRLTQSNYEDLVRVQRMLGRMGIFSKIRGSHLEKEQDMPGGRYVRRKSWRLIISGKHAARYMEVIGFLDSSKTEKWFALTDGMSKGFYNKPGTAQFVALKPAGRADVYDVTVADVHAFDANGLYVHNCAEQSLESGECCTLVETYLNRHDDLDDYLKTLKYAFLYGKSVTLLPTHWADTNAIMQRNRRIGTSMSGIANFADNHGMTELREWMNRGYETVRNYDETYSEWLGIRESIKTTTVKPSGTVSILAGESPGVHWSPGGEYFLRGIVFQKDDPMVKAFKEAGYKVEKSAYTPETSVYVQFPVKSLAKRSEKDVTIFEKANLAVLAQRYWSDNSVSVTLSFDKETEGHHVGTVLHMHDGQLKTVSFLPMGNDTYAQMPYTQITQQQYEKYLSRLQPIDLKPVYKGNAIDAMGEVYCSTEACEIPIV